MEKKYYMYQITNKLNGKIYIGVHQTTNIEDGYMGSGTYLKRAQEKHGIENFEKEILKMFDNEDDMYQEEIVYVDREFVLREDTYNLTEGGNGGGFEASSKGGKKGGKIQGKLSYEKNIGWFSEDAKVKQRKWTISETNLTILLDNCNMIKNSKEIQKKRKATFKEIKHQQGSKNSQFGMMWVTNGIDSKKIKKEDSIPTGWKRGRIQKKK